MKKYLSLILAFMLALTMLVSCVDKTTASLSSAIRKSKLVTEYDQNTSIDEMDTVTFGTYPKDDISGETKDAIEWIVLEKDTANKKALLLSKYLLDSQRYNSEEADVSWEECSLRKWLNDTFYNKAFNEDEKNVIITSRVSNTAAFMEVEGEDFATMDKVFLLSVDEVRKYFGEGVEDVDGEGYQLGRNVATKGTNYAKMTDLNEHQLWVDEEEEEESLWANGNSTYWLRTAGANLKLVAFVFSDGFVNTFGNYVEAIGGGVRPAIWVNYK